MSILDDEEFREWSSTILGTLQSNIPNSAYHQKLIRLIKDDIDNVGGRDDGGIIFHKHASLTRDDLTSAEMSLGATAQGDAYASNDDIDNQVIDKSDAYMAPQPYDLNVPRLREKYPRTDLTPRGNRNALYEALEQFCMQPNPNNNTPPNHIHLNAIMSLLHTIRKAVSETYLEQWKQVTPLREISTLSTKAGKYADTYVLKALNDRNVSKGEKMEHVYDLLARTFEQELLKNMLDQFHACNQPTGRIYQDMRSIKSQARNQHRAM